jgi:ligand-binding sensor domain-containing protein/two-component sensor histidine kinase
MGLVSIFLAQASSALDPAKSTSQYVHSRWGKDKGFIGGTVYAICQSNDGYLWIGTDRGLVRFDGEKFALIQRPLPDQPDTGPVRGLVEDSDGNLWVRSQGPQMLIYRDGQFRNAFANGGLPLSVVTAMSPDGHGGVLFTELINRSIRYAHGSFETVAASTEAIGVVTSMAETLDGRIWLGTRDDGLLVIKDGKPVLSSIPNLENEKINALVATNNGGLWIGTDQGLRFESPRTDINIAFPEWNKQTQMFGLVQDAAGNLWGASSRGLIRLSASGEFSVLNDGEKRPEDVTAVYEDRDGSIWFGGPKGLERLQDGLFATYSLRDGFPPSNGSALHVDASKRVWFAPVSGGLYMLDRGRVQPIRLDGLDHDVVYSISGTGNEIWVGRQHGGLTRIIAQGDAMSSRTYRHAEGLAQNTVFSTSAVADGSVWAGTISGGLSHFKNDVFSNYSMSNGLSSNAVNSLVTGYDGTIWVGTSAGLDAFRNGAWSHWRRAEGLPSSEVRTCFEDSQHVLWLLTASGLAYLSSGKVVVPNHLPDALRDQLFGITDDGLGFLWLSSSDQVIRVNRSRLLADGLHESDVRVIGESEGLIGAEGVRRDRSILIGPNGRIWVSVQNGFAFSDPARSLHESRPVSVRIESIAAAGKILHANEALRIPARTHSITFQFSGASLDSSEGIWYRYLLEGADQAWSDPVQMRQVSYNNLHFGTYRFRVMASLDGILWNGPEADVSLSIDQAFWETWWFRTGSVLLVVLIVLSLFRLRMVRLSHQLNSRFQERLTERTRIAQELHDTLLQSFQGLMLRFQIVDSLLPTEPDEAKATLEDALERADNALAESRDAIQNIRPSSIPDPNLSRALSVVLEEVQGAGPGGDRPRPTCSIVVEGREQELREYVMMEICRIVREALRNAFQHAQASHVETELSFRDIELRLSLRDDGLGIDPSVLINGSRSGHWGIIGMRERAARLGAQLNFWSKPGAGTEIELTVPGKIAYKSSPARLFGRFRNRTKS